MVTSTASASLVIRILSDLHFGDPSTAVSSLSSLRPLFDGADEIVLNGDTLDTRPSINPQRTAALLDEVRTTFLSWGRPVTFLTGNHDPDIASVHVRHFLEHRLFVTHGDALFEDLVPWSRDAPLARKFLAEELAALAPQSPLTLDTHLAAVRRAAFRLPQRHQSYPRGLRHLVEMLQDTIWPPSRVVRILRAWRETPSRVDAFLAQHHVRADFFAMGHTHKLGAFRTPGGRVILNTGAFCPPARPGAIDLADNRILLRAVERRADTYRIGEIVAEFSLAGK